jgi:hypothetical protein
LLHDDLAVSACLATPIFAASYKSTDGSAPTLPFVLQDGDRVYAATIGLDWVDLPTSKHIYWGSPSGRLTFSGPIYLTGLTESPGNVFIPFATPRLLSNEEWFAVPFSYKRGELTGRECCFYHPCPDEPGYPLTFQSRRQRLWSIRDAAGALLSYEHRA